MNKQNIHIKKLFILYLHHYVSFVTKMLDSGTKVLSFLYTDLSRSLPSPFEVNSTSELLLPSFAAFVAVVVSRSLKLC